MCRGQQSAGSASRILFVEGPFNTPIMRYILLAPGAVVEVWLLSAGSIAFKKAPIAVEGRSNSSIYPRLRKCSGDNRKNCHNHPKDDPGGRASFADRASHCFSHSRRLTCWLES